MAEAKRQQIQKKVAAGVARNNDRGRTTVVDRVGERALEAKDRFTEFAKEHPITTIAGGVALGILVSSLFRGSPTRKLGKEAGKQASKLAAVGAELAMAYAAQALAASEETRKAGAEKLGELGETALKYGKSGTDTATEVARTAGKRIARAIHGRFN
jgi:hypothetical protein